jgi:lipopolysaccharide transport system permease protein
VILPLSTVVTNSIDLLINVILLFLISLFFKFIPSLFSIVIIVISYVISAMTAAGIGLFLSSLNVKYRDVRYILPFFIQLLIFLTPVIYPTSIVKSVNKLIFSLNPMTGVIENIRAVISGSGIDYLMLGISGLVSIFIFLIGLAFFNATEKFFADVI